MLGEDSLGFTTILSSFADLYVRMEKYEAAEPLYKRVVENIERVAGRNSLKYLETLGELGRVYQYSGKTNEAESLFLKAYKICCDAYDSSETLVWIAHSLAQINEEKGENKKAIQYYEEAIKACKGALGEENEIFTTLLGNLASLQIQMENYEKAELLYRRILELKEREKGKDDIGYLETLGNLAGVYQNMGETDKAEQLYLTAYQICRRCFFEEEAAAGIPYNLAKVQEAKGNQDKAISYYNEAIEAGRRVLGENSLDFAKILNGLADLYVEQRDYGAAETLYIEILNLKKHGLGENDPEYASTLCDLGNLYFRIERFDIALNLLGKALKINRATLGEKHSEHVKILETLAEIHKLMGNYEDAELLYKECLELISCIVGKEHSAHADILRKAASLYSTMADHDKAQRLLKQALQIYEKNQLHEDDYYLLTLVELGNSYYEIGDYDRYAGLFAEAQLIVTRKFKRCSHINPRILMELAGFYMALGEYEVADHLLGAAFETEEKVWGSDRDGALAMHMYGSLYHEKGDYETAAMFYARAIEVLMSLWKADHNEWAPILYDASLLYLDMGKYDIAIRLLEKALMIKGKVFEEDHAIYVGELLALSQGYLAISRLEEGLSLAKRCIDIEDKEIIRLFSFFSTRQQLRYLEVMRTSLDIYLSIFLEYFSDSLQEIQYALNVVLKRKGIAAEALAAQRDVILGGKYPDLAPKVKELTELRMKIAKKTLEGPGPEGPEAHERFLWRLYGKKEKIESDLASQIPEMNLRKRLESADRATISAALPKGSVLVEFVRFNPFDFKAIPAKGEEQWKPPRYLAFVMLAREPENISMIDLGDADAIDNMIAEYRASIARSPNARSKRDMAFVEEGIEEIPGKNVGRELRIKIFDPLLEAIADHKRIFIAPDGDLTKLPFEVLPMYNDDYLIDKYSISYLGVGRDMLRFEYEVTGSPSPALVVADPDFDLGMNNGLIEERKYKNILPISKKLIAQQARQISEDNTNKPQAPPSCLSRDMTKERMKFNRLSGTKAEGQKIAAMLGARSLMGKTALEGKVKACESPKILHIASHGFFLADQERNLDNNRRCMISLEWERPFGMRQLSASRLESPMLRSGLVLAGVNTWLKGGRPPAEAEDGILTAEDVSGLNLLNTELVVLSACETGLGEVKRGEGVFGLRRAFVLAGARTLVMSLWKVRDKQTQELMIEFYRRILGGKPRSDALREAQLEIKKKYPDPLNWGAFICQGDPSPLPLPE